MTDEPERPPADNVLQLHTAMATREERCVQGYLDGVNELRRRLFELVEGAMLQGVNVIDLAQAMLDGASIATIMAAKTGEDPVEEHVRLLVAQARLALLGLQVEGLMTGADEE
jgi:hypothetical protein